MKSLPSAAHEPCVLPDNPDADQHKPLTDMMHSAAAEKNKQAHAQKKYSQSDIQKAVNDDRAKRGRATKHDQETMQQRIERETEHKTKEIADRLDATLAKMRNATEKNDAYETAIATSNAEKLAAIEAASIDPENQVIKQLKTKLKVATALEAQHEIDLCHGLIAATKNPFGYGIVPRTTPRPSIKKNGLPMGRTRSVSPIERLKNLFG